jgi:hypothetical protein
MGVAKLIHDLKKTMKLVSSLSLWNPGSSSRRLKGNKCKQWLDAGDPVELFSGHPLYKQFFIRHPIREWVKRFTLLFAIEPP